MQILRLLALGCFLSGSFLVSAQAPAAAPDRAPAPAADTAKKAAVKKKRDWYPFVGQVVAVNTTAKTVILKKAEGERVLRLDGSSTLSSRGKVATLADIKVGDYAHGKLHKNGRDEEVITDAKFDLEAPKKAIKKAAKAAKKKTADAAK